MTDYLKNARILELIDRYEIFNGYSYARGEIAEHAPDVLQAYTDAFVEAQMLCRARTDEVLDALVKDPSQRGRSPELIRQDAQINLLDPKPTINYPFRDLHGFWARLEAYQANVMHDAGVLQHSYTPDEYLRVIQGRFMARTYAKVGWKVPTWPPFLPDGWTGRVGHPPYPPYGLMYMGKQSFPGPGDLVAGAHA
jgi:sulfonate transport system substrate-binding protein